MNSDETYSNRFQSTVCGQQGPSDARTSNQQQTQYSGLQQTVNTKCWVSFESSTHPVTPKFFLNFRGFAPQQRGKREGQKRHSSASGKVARWTKILPRYDLKKSSGLGNSKNAESFGLTEPDRALSEFQRGFAYDVQTPDLGHCLLTRNRLRCRSQHQSDFLTRTKIERVHLCNDLMDIQPLCQNRLSACQKDGTACTSIFESIRPR